MDKELGDQIWEKIWKVDWNDEMSVGIPEIDEDHKRFLSLVNEFNKAVTESAGLDEIKSKLQLIIDDTERHFSHEEILFGEWHYPEAEVHATKHANIMKTLKGIMATISSDGHDTEWIAAGLKIKLILVNHILKEDMKYTDSHRKIKVPDAA